VIGNADFLYASGITTVELRGAADDLRKDAPPSYSLALTVRPLAHRDCRSGQRVALGAVKALRDEACAWLCSLAIIKRPLRPSRAGLASAISGRAFFPLTKCHSRRTAQASRIVAMAVMASMTLGARRGRCRHRHGHRHDVAIESAGVTLLKGDLKGSCGRAPVRSDDAQHQGNLFFALSTMPRVPIAAGILYPTFGILLSLSSRPPRCRSPRSA